MSLVGNDEMEVFLSLFGLRLFKQAKKYRNKEMIAWCARESGHMGELICKERKVKKRLGFFMGSDCDFKKGYVDAKKCK